MLVIYTLTDKYCTKSVDEEIDCDSRWNILLAWTFLERRFRVGDILGAKCKEMKILGRHVEKKIL